MILNNRKNLIGVAARMGGGKDTVASIIQYLTCNPTQQANIDLYKWDAEVLSSASPFTIRKYADKLKDIVCLLIGCTRTQLEDRVFKQTELGENWRIYVKTRHSHAVSTPTRELISKEEYEKEISSPYKIPESVISYHTEVLTPRTLMQRLGTEGGRKIIHPQIWINALFSEYKPYSKGVAATLDNWSDVYGPRGCKYCSAPYYGFKNQRYCEKCINDNSVQIYPTWVISDVRYPITEGTAVLEHGGFNIGVKRLFSMRFPEYAHLEDPANPYDIPKSLDQVNGELYYSLTHESEELMGDFSWCDYVIENNGTLEELVEKVRKILTLEEIITTNE